MPLVQPVLKQGIQSILSSQPKTLAQASLLWANAIFNYSAAGLAGALTPLPSLNVATLQGLFTKSMAGKSFMNDLGSNLQQWWTPVVWVGPAFTGITVIVAPLQSAIIGQTLTAPNNKVQAADFISGQIHIWTSTIVCSATNTASGVTAPIPFA
jgi:hypothetical protein